MRRVGIAGVLFLLGACGDPPPARETVSQAPPAAPAPARTTEPQPASNPSPAEQELLASVPVYVGGDAEFHACSGLSQVVARNTGRKHTIVRSGPGARHAATDTLPLGFQVFSCAEEAAWTGVVYDAGNDNLDCGVSTPIAERRVYQGPCKSGWIENADLEVVAG